MSIARISQRGGAHVGWLSASWPLASIRIAPGSLTVSMLGHYVFVPADVDAIESVGAIPLLSTGIRIHHTRPDYPEKIVFYGVGRDRMLQAASAAGFRVGEPHLQTKRGFPVRFSAIAVFLLLWNGLFLLYTGGHPFDRPSKPGLFAIVPFAMACATATLALRFPRLQQLILREGRHIGEVRGFLRFTQLIMGVMAFASGLGLWWG
jgi:hypothetical protein